MRFSPSAVGSRQSDLYAQVINPVTNETETINLATLKGEGGAPEEPNLPDEPQTPSDPVEKPISSVPSGDKEVTVPAGGFVTIRSRARVKVRPWATPVVRITTRGAATRLQVPRKARVRIGSKRFAVRVLAPRRICANCSAVVGIKANRRLLRSLKDRSAKLRLPVTVRSGKRSHRQVVRIVLR